MTTIAYKDGIMAGDTQITNGGLAHSGVNKVFRLNQCLIGIGGDARVIHALVDRLTEMLPDDMENATAGGHAGLKECGEAIVSVVQDDDMEFSMIAVCPTTTDVYFFDHTGLPLHVGDGNNICFAIGSGQDIAMGAMRAGASADEAVKIACDLDIYTGGEVGTVYL